MIYPEPRRLLLVHAHPDDESLTTGGTIACYAAAGVEVTLVTCTLGEDGEIIPAGLDQLGASAADQLGGYRAGELAVACAALGVDKHRYLGGIGRWRDSGMAGTPAAEHPRAFVGGAFDEQVSQLRALVDELRPQVVLSYDSFGGYGHPDHIRAHEITMASTADAESVSRVFHTAASASATARGLAELPAVPFRVPAVDELPTVPDERITTVIDIEAHLDAKIAALHAHATQIHVPDSAACFALSNQIAQPILPAEYFVLASGPESGCDSDLFGGL